MLPILYKDLITNLFCCDMLSTTRQRLAKRPLSLVVFSITPHCPCAHNGGHGGENGELGS